MTRSDNKFDIARTKDELDVERHHLGTTVRLSDGTEGLVFSRGPKNESNFFLYNCHLCGVPNLPGERCLQTHITGRKHQSRLSQPIVDAVGFRAPLIQKTKIQMNIAPGEPVPPGFENEVKPLAEIQCMVDSFKEGALIGIEYSIEILSKEDKEPSYLCILCDKKGDPRSIFAHLTSYNHRLKYLEKHFPTIVKELVPYRYNPEARNVMPRIVQMVSEAVEDHHGRLAPTVCESSDFKRNRNKIVQDIMADKHFDEKNGPSFINVIDRRTIDDLIKNSKGSIAINIDSHKKRDPSPPRVKPPKRSKIDNLSAIRKDRDSLDSISSDDSEMNLGRPLARDRRQSSPNLGKRKRKSQSPAYRIMGRTQRSPPFEELRPVKERKTTLPTPKELSKQASEIAQERYKWEKYRCLLEIAVKEFEKVLKDHEKNPEKHPLYPDEWKKFWNRRYKELQSEKKDPNKHDFKPEWIIFWTKRMKELHEEDIEKKKIEIKKKLDLPEDGQEKTDQLKQQYKIKAPAKVEKLPVINISDDESISSHSKSKKNTRSVSRSLSSLSDEEYDKKSKKPYKTESESRDKYPSDYYRHSSREWARGYYAPPPSHYSSYRTMDPYNYPQYEPPKKEDEEELDEGPLTVIAVLRLLTALEDHLGSLGPKVVDLLAKALALEKVKANSSDEILLNDDNSVFFETVKEKLKGQLIADVLDPHKIKAVKKAIKNIAAIIHQVNEKAEVAKKAAEDKQKEQEEVNEVKKVKIPSKELPFDRQLVASKLAAALVMQERTDISTEDMDRLIQSFILMVKISKERTETVHVNDLLIELGIVIPDQVEEQIEEEYDVEDFEKDLPVDMFDINEDTPDPAPAQSTVGALESLTDSDLQTLLQNFKHLSSEEQHHLISHLKKLESNDPVRVEKLRKFVDPPKLTEGKEDNTPPKSSLDENSKKKPSDLYSDEDSQKLDKILDSDDDDYNFDDVMKIASNNVKDRDRTEEKHRSEPVNKERDEEASNMSSNSATTNLNMSLADTQNLIANLMGSLQKNNANYSNQGNNSNSIDGKTTNIASFPNRNNPNSNISSPFFQQQIPQIQVQATPQQPTPQQQMHQQQSQNSNMNRMNPLNNTFGQDNFNITNLQYNPQSPGQNYKNYNPFNSYPQQLQLPPMQQSHQILQDYILQQQNFRAQHRQPSGNNF